MRLKSAIFNTVAVGGLLATLVGAAYQVQPGIHAISHMLDNGLYDTLRAVPGSERTTSARLAILMRQQEGRIARDRFLGLDRLGYGAKAEIGANELRNAGIDPTNDTVRAQMHKTGFVIS
ncbi:MAG: hypothetical protein H6865_00355 [Rhodospirillales bacterium]|nr:hypothetical protein [Alphaproteobacteria bacterium]MCB9986077.1 hypothetical protein [Rhodospirillales bacterium]USO07356.1 MAG: hypothetical protein H6866_08020 [Rhodospirillales bacterium]